jgi:putative oxidoreductase
MQGESNMSKGPLIARILLGLIFFVFGLNGFLNFIPMPAEIPEPMKTFMAGMMATGYFFPFLKATEVICGALLLAGVWVPLALVVLAPIILNILAVHTFMDRSGLPMALVIAALETYLAFFSPYSGPIRNLFRK